MATVAWLSVGGAAHAATYKPTRFDDPVPGKCKAKDCSLREAITAANERDGNDTVSLGKGRYKIELPDGISDDNSGGDFDVIDKVTIKGKGPSKTTVDGKGISTVFTLLTFSSHSLRDMTITGGSDPDGGGISTGPAPATLDNLLVKGNTSARGAGLYTVSTDIEITNSTFSGNTGGSGIVVPAGFVGTPSVTIRNSTFSQNSGALGGAIYLDGANSGGADDDPTATIINSTVFGNSADVSGGGIAAILGATVEAKHVTVAENKADADNSSGGAGGGIYQSTSAGFTFDDSILSANSVGSSGTDAQCSGTFNGIGSTVSSPPGCSSFGFLNVVTSNQITGAFGNFGGRTKTVKLAPSSPAFGAAIDCPKRDQRGKKRPTSDCDSGSFENKPE